MYLIFNMGTTWPLRLFFFFIPRVTWWFSWGWNILMHMYVQTLSSRAKASGVALFRQRQQCVHRCPACDHHETPRIFTRWRRQLVVCRRSLCLCLCFFANLPSVFLPPFYYFFAGWQTPSSSSGGDRQICGGSLAKAALHLSCVHRNGCIALLAFSERLLGFSLPPAVSCTARSAAVRRYSQHATGSRTSFQVRISAAAP